MNRLLHRTIMGVTSMMMLGFLGSASVQAADNMYLSYGVSLDSKWEVYPYTGFSTTEDVKDITVAVKFPAEQVAQYAGNKLTAMYIGWAGVHQAYKPDATAFVRTGLNSANDAEQKVSLTDPSGWNVVTFDTPYEITENSDIYIGYTVDMKSGVYGPCTLCYGSFPEGTHFISRPDIKGEDGNPEWIDLATPGMMDMACPIIIMGEIEVNGDEFTNRAAISKAVMPSVLTAGETGTAAIELTNTGSNEISSITVTYSQPGQEDWSMDLPLSSDLDMNDKAMVSIPVLAYAAGESTLSISKVNDQPNGDNSEYKFTPLVVGKDVASRYTRRPLVEYIASESEYRSADYDDNIVTPVLEAYADRVSRISWHCDDQFQLGLADDKDEVIDFLIEIAKGDKMQVYLPTLMLDRAINLGIPANYVLYSFKTPMMGILYSPAAEYSYDYALEQPTFAGLNVSFSVEDGNAVVNVYGDADTSVLPEGEDMMLTVVLVEDGVETDSQEFPGGDGEGSNAGHAVHNNLVRQCLTGIYGEPVKMEGDKFSATFNTELDYDNVAKNMRAVAFLHRPMSNGMWERTVINSAEAKADLSGVMSINGDADNLRPIVAARSIMAPAGATMHVYTLAGMAVNPTSLQPGMYVVSVSAQGAASTYKVIVK